MIYLYCFLLLIIQINLGSICHLNIKFSIEKEEDGCLPFLDVNIFRENDKFATNVYRKKTFNGIYTNFKKFIPETYKMGYYFGVSVCALILSNLIMRLIN